LIFGAEVKLLRTYRKLMAESSCSFFIDVAAKATFMAAQRVRPNPWTLKSSHQTSSYMIWSYYSYSHYYQQGRVWDMGLHFVRDWSLDSRDYILGAHWYYVGGTKSCDCWNVSIWFNNEFWGFLSFRTTDSKSLSNECHIDSIEYIAGVVLAAVVPSTTTRHQQNKMVVYFPFLFWNSNFIVFVQK
jgi:hypothetical protein